MEFSQATPQSIIEEAEAQGLHASLNDGRLPRDYYHSDITYNEFTKLKLDRHVGEALVEAIAHTTTVDQLSISIEALRQWLHGRNDRLHTYHDTTHDTYRVPTSSIRKTLL